MTTIKKTASSIKILFLHGLDSSKDSTKFAAIEAPKKYCIDVDYRNLNYATVQQFYRESISTIQPDLLIGHSLGGYWALKMSLEHRIPAIIANPSLHPDFRTDYPCITDVDLDHDIPQMAYLELGDEILDMHQAIELLDPYMQISVVQGGHHRLAQPQNLNLMIDDMLKTFM